MEKYKPVNTGTMKGNDRRVLLDILSVAMENYTSVDIPKDGLTELEWHLIDQKTREKTVKSVNRFVTRNITLYDKEMEYDWYVVMDDVEDSLLNDKHSLYFDGLKKAAKNG
jgi:hypothetical protein